MREEFEFHREVLEHLYPLNLREASRSDIFAYFNGAWQLCEWLFDGLDRSDPRIDSVQPNPFRNTLAFYYGHTAAFYANTLRKAGLLDEPLSQWDGSMAKGVWPKDISEITSQNWPTFGQLRDYRESVYRTVTQIIENADLTTPVDQESPLWALLMGIEHDLIHFQTSVPLIRQAPLEMLTPPRGWELYRGGGPSHYEESEWIAFGGGEVSCGRKRGEDRYYGWDNEYGEVRVVVKPFRIRKYPVSNREFLEFVLDGGYRDRSLWRTPEAEVWFGTFAPEHPASWVDDGGGGYRYRAPFEEMEMPWEWPVEVNKHEAAAYAVWAGVRLIREAEFRYLLHLDFPDDESLMAGLRGMNVNMRRCSPVPVGESTGPVTGVDLYGNVARWADGSFGPLREDDFRTHPLYPDFSYPWFRGDHTVLLGAGYTSSGHMMHMGLMRDFMQNHMDQVAGITLVQEVR